ncbi:MAG: hypothetical protein KAJ48_08010 [Elusimicrobiales bacterium]|nr:hypothetical protein [Elusimicrobiales bacterium]
MPDKNKIHQNKPLEQISVRYSNSDFIADKVSPAYNVKKDSNDYYVYSKDNFRIDETLRANGGEANKVTWDASTASYSLKKHSLKDIVTDDDRDNADVPLSLDADTTEYLTEKIQLRKEKDLIDIIHTNGNWANESSLAATGAWSANTTVSNPILAMDSATSTILKSCGKMPNVAVMNFPTFLAAKEHVSITDKIKYTSADSVTESMLAKLFTIDKVHVSKAIYDSSLEGITASLGYLMTDVCWVGYVNKAPGRKKISAFTTFENNNNPKVKKWREEKKDGDMIEVTRKYQHKPVATDCGYLVVHTIQ